MAKAKLKTAKPKSAKLKSSSSQRRRGAAPKRRSLQRTAARKRPAQKFTVSHHREEDFEGGYGAMRNTATSALRTPPAEWCART